MSERYCCLRNRRNRHGMVAEALGAVMVMFQTTLCRPPQGLRRAQTPSKAGTAASKECQSARSLLLCFR